MIRNGPQNKKRVLWILLSIAYATATAKPIHSAKSASTSPSTNYPRQPALSIDQAHGCVINVVAISNSVLRPNTKSPVKRQLDLHVSLPLYNNHFLIRAFLTIKKKQAIQRKDHRPRPSSQLQQAQNFMQRPRL